jgi:hypothetical protein
MQPSSYFKQSRLAEPRREALEWLAQQLRWERTLDRLRSQHPVMTRKAA